MLKEYKMMASYAFHNRNSWSISIHCYRINSHLLLCGTDDIIIRNMEKIRNKLGE